MNANQSTLVDPDSIGLADHFHVYYCGHLDFPSSGIDCSTRYPDQCFKCKFVFQYFTGESVNDYQGWGHLVFRIMAIICALVGFLGIIGNTIIVLVVQHRPGKRRSFDFLISVLAHVDNLCCLSCIFYSLSAIAYFDNLFGRDFLNLWVTYYSALSAFLWRVLSFYITLFITEERYLAIAYPIRSRSWINLTKTKIKVFLIFALATAVTLCRTLGAYVGKNIYGNQTGGLDIPSARGYRYAIVPTKLHLMIMESLVIPIYIFEYWVPVGGLLVLNILTLIELKRVAKRRHEMSSTQQDELKPVRMFIPVVIVFFLTNLWPPLCYQLIQKRGYNYREGWALYALVTTFNSSANFWIYYCTTEFRQETNRFMEPILKKLAAFKLPKHEQK